MYEVLIQPEDMLTEKEVNEIFKKLEVLKANKAANEREINDLIQKIYLTKYKLILLIVKKYNNYQYIRDDLVSIATMGFLKAVDCFDINKNVKFNSYLTKVLDNEILMHLRKTRKQQNESFLDDAIFYNKDYRPIKLIDVLEDVSIKDNAEVVNNGFYMELIRRYIKNNFTKREKYVFCHSYGVLGADPMTQEEMSKVLKVSRSFISRIATTSTKRVIAYLEKREKRIKDKNNYEKEY